MAGNAENVSISWRHHENTNCAHIYWELMYMQSNQTHHIKYNYLLKQYSWFICVTRTRYFIMTRTGQLISDQMQTTMYQPQIMKTISFSKNFNRHCNPDNCLTSSVSHASANYIANTFSEWNGFLVITCHAGWCFSKNKKQIARAFYKSFQSSLKYFSQHDADRFTYCSQKIDLHNDDNI